MAVSIVMPALEMAQETGKIISWLKKEGDSISKGEPIAEIETDKVVLEVEAAADGVLAGVSAAAGDVVQVGKTIAWIVAPGEKPPVEAESGAPAARTMSEQSRAATTVASAAPAGRPEVPEAKASPKARRMAKELGVDLSKVRGTGPGGTISGEDVEAAAKAAPPSPAPVPVSSGPVALSSIARL